LDTFYCGELLYFCLMLSVESYQKHFLEYLKQYSILSEPKTLYEPIQYILNLGGKRLRPVLTLMTCEIFGADYRKALDASLSVEVFHNFSLIHDDIMDGAPLRRGQETVHNKWNLNTGILSGDAMLIMAYRLFENYEGTTFKFLAQLFGKTAIRVCEGQQYDIDFELRDDVSINEYLTMIEYKTAVLLGAAMQMGAIVANASEEDQSAIYEFGKNLGIAFQLQDDYLDVYGDPDIFGKQVGGDIVENKKTFLYLKALELLDEENKEKIQSLYRKKTSPVSDKIEIVKNLFSICGSEEAMQAEIKNYTNNALSVLNAINISEDKKNLLRTFGLQLMKRDM